VHVLLQVALKECSPQEPGALCTQVPSVLHAWNEEVSMRPHSPGRTYAEAQGKACPAQASSSVTQASLLQRECRGQAASRAGPWGALGRGKDAKDQSGSGSAGCRPGIPSCPDGQVAKPAGGSLLRCPGPPLQAIMSLHRCLPVLVPAHVCTGARTDACVSLH